MVQQDQDTQDIFVGRRDEQEQYNKFLRGEEMYWMLFFTGIPGIGKSRLLSQLKEQTPVDVGIIHINFQDDDPYPHLLTDPLQVLEALAVSANNFCNKQQFNDFMNALQKGHEQLKQFKEQISNQLEQLSIQISEPQELAQVKQKVLSAEQELHRNVREIVTGTFYAQIDTLEKKRLVLMFDTCELLNKPEGLEVGQWLIGELLPKLHKRMDQLDRRCLVVIGSRIPLETEVIQGQDQQCFDLAMLKKEEVNEYLEKAGIGVKIDNSTLWEENIYKITHGHPLSLSIFLKLWDEEDEKPSSDEDEDIAAFQSKFDEKVSTDFVEERILNRLTPPSEY